MGSVKGWLDIIYYFSMEFFNLALLISVAREENILKLLFLVKNGVESYVIMSYISSLSHWLLFNTISSYVGSWGCPSSG